MYNSIRKCIAVFAWKTRLVLLLSVCFLNIPACLSKRFVFLFYPVSSQKQKTSKRRQFFLLLSEGSDNLYLLLEILKQVQKRQALCRIKKTVLRSVSFFRFKLYGYFFNKVTKIHTKCVCQHDNRADPGFTFSVLNLGKVLNTPACTFCKLILSNSQALPCTNEDFTERTRCFFHLVKANGE